jgi:hypothetical protein
MFSVVLKSEYAVSLADDLLPGCTEGATTIVGTWFAAELPKASSKVMKTAVLPLA